MKSHLWRIAAATSPESRNTATGCGCWLDGDTYASPASYEVALHAVGGTMRGLDEVMTGKVDHAFAVVRPPGHHATTSEAMGFCLFNNIAIAARYAWKNYKLERILIVDFDVHHGNGTQQSDSPRFACKGGVVVFTLKDYLAPEVAKALAERGGTGVGAGCHCAHLTVKHLLNIHPLLAQFQRLIVTLFPQLSLPGVARVSLGIENNEEDIDMLINILGTNGWRTQGWVEQSIYFHSDRNSRAVG